MWDYILTFLVGAAVPLIAFWLERRDKRKYFEIERKDKYKLAAIEKRLEVHQQAFSLWRDLREVIHENNDQIRFNVINNANYFWFNNCLYLEKKTREELFKVISLVANYNLELQMWRAEEPGPEKEKRIKEIKKGYKVILSLSATIMKDVVLEPFNITEEKDALGNKK